MCWMSIYRGEEAAADALRACRENERLSGGHSWGLAAVIDGSLVVSKGLGTIPDGALELTDEIDVDVALGHTRKATRGNINLENAHPFLVYDTDGDALAALAHNGTWYEAPDDGHCDSYHIARLLETLIRADPDRDFSEAVRLTGEITGETITVLHRDGTGYVYAGRFGITEAEGCVRSSGGSPIRQGSVVEL